MKFKVTKLKQAEKEIAALTPKQQKELADDYNIIENKGIEFVKGDFCKKGFLKLKPIMYVHCLNIKKTKLY